MWFGELPQRCQEDKRKAQDSERELVQTLLDVTRKFCRKKITSAIATCTPVEDSNVDKSTTGATGTLLDIDPVVEVGDTEMEVELSMQLAFLVKDKAV